MSHKANPYDNAAMESFRANHKRECVGLWRSALIVFGCSHAFD